MEQTKICEKYCTRRLANLTGKCEFCFESCETIRKAADKQTKYIVKCTESNPSVTSTYEQEFVVGDNNDEAVLIQERWNVNKNVKDIFGPTMGPWTTTFPPIGNGVRSIDNGIPVVYTAGTSMNKSANTAANTDVSGSNTTYADMKTAIDKLFDSGKLSGN